MSADHAPQPGTPIIGINHVTNTGDAAVVSIDLRRMRPGSIAISGQPGFGTSGGAHGTVN